MSEPINKVSVAYAARKILQEKGYKAGIFITSDYVALAYEIAPMQFIKAEITEKNFKVGPKQIAKEFEAKIKEVN